MSDIYPYEKDASYHPDSFVFFNVPGCPAFGIEVADAIAKHVEAVKDGRIKYDALGSSGGPWEAGRWIPVEDDRMFVQATIPDKDISDYSDEEIAEAEAALRALKAAKLADAVKTEESEETVEGEG